MSSIIESISDAFYTLDGEWRFTYVNRKAEEIWGRSRDELLGRNIWEEFSQAVDSKPYRWIVRAAREGVTTEFETVSPVLGTWIAGRAYPSPGGVSVYFQDVTERKRAEEALQEVREAERSRISYDLHDGALQDLTYALTEVQLVQTMSEDQELDRRLGRAVDALKHAGQEIREAVYDLRLGEERDRLIPELLESLVERYRSMLPQSHIRVEVKDGFPASPLGKRGMELLQIVQDALTNARKHSDARNITVSLGDEGG